MCRASSSRLGLLSSHSVNAGVACEGSINVEKMSKNKSEHEERGGRFHFRKGM